MKDQNKQQTEYKQTGKRNPAIGFGLAIGGGLGTALGSLGLGLAVGISVTAIVSAANRWHKNQREHSHQPE